MVCLGQEANDLDRLTFPARCILRPMLQSTPGTTDHWLQKFVDNTMRKPFSLFLLFGLFLLRAAQRCLSLSPLFTTETSQ